MRIYIWNENAVIGRRPEAGQNSRLQKRAKLRLPEAVRIQVDIWLVNQKCGPPWYFGASSRVTAHSEVMHLSVNALYRKVDKVVWKGIR